MSEEKWSKYPWQVSGGGVGIYDADKHQVGRAFGMTQEEMIANRDLQTAAPAMYRALEAITESASDGRTIPEWLEERLFDARAALKAARGERDGE